MEKAIAIQKAFLDELAELEGFLRLFDYLPDVYFYAKDRSSRFMKLNTASAQMHGCSSDLQMVGTTDHDYHPPHLADQYVAEDRRVMQTGKPLPHQVWLVPNHTGRLQWYVSSKIPLFNTAGDIMGIAGVMRDLESAQPLQQSYHEFEDVLAYVLRRYSERIEISALAEMAHLSVSQFDRKFKRLFQMTPQQYVQRVRINAACQQLTSTRLSVAEIAQSTGFYDQSYFTKQFRKHMQMTPLAYRKHYGTAEL